MCREAEMLRARLLNPLTAMNMEINIWLTVHSGGLVSMNVSEAAGVKALLLGRMEYFKLLTHKWVELGGECTRGYFLLLFTG